MENNIYIDDIKSILEDNGGLDINRFNVIKKYILDRDNFYNSSEGDSKLENDNVYIKFFSEVKKEAKDKSIIIQPDKIFGKIKRSNYIYPLGTPLWETAKKITDEHGLEFWRSSDYSVVGRDYGTNKLNNNKITDTKSLRTIVENILTVEKKLSRLETRYEDFLYNLANSED